MVNDLRLRASLMAKISNPCFPFPAATNRLFIGNLSWETTRESLGDHFESCDGFVSARVAWDMDRQRSRGFGFVEFQTPEQAEAAMQVSIGGKACLKLVVLGTVMLFSVSVGRHVRSCAIALVASTRLDLPVSCHYSDCNNQ
jgi:hypothetical protein